MQLYMDFISNAVDGYIRPTTVNYKELVITGVTTDSRNVNKGDIFIALKGEFFNGQNYIKEALKKGAVCAMCESDYVSTENEPIIQVSNTSKALMDLAEKYLEKNRKPVIAITGSTGKTTTKDMVASVISEKYRVHKTEGNFNNEIGLPLTIFSMPDDTEVLVLEMGMNMVGEIDNLSRIAKPNVCVITNIGVTHIESLGTQENIFKEKCAIFNHMDKAGIAVLFDEDIYLKTLEGKFEKEIWYGLSDKSDVYAKNIELKGIEGVSFYVCAGGHELSVNLNYLGKHMAISGACGAAVGYLFGLSDDEIRRGIENFSPTKMRLSVKTLENGITVIDDCYNASPISMEASISILGEANTRKVAILGDMRELGEVSQKYHRQLGKFAGKSKADVFVCIGEKSKYVFEALKAYDKEKHYFKTQEEFHKVAKEILKQGDTVLVKASRGEMFEHTVQRIGEMQFD